jgi:hypothetical protein
MWAYCAYHATLFDNILIRKDTKETPWKMFYGTNPDHISNLLPFGNMCIVRKNAKIQSKLINRGFPAIYLGPALNHKPGVHSCYNYKTKHAILSRNYVLLNQTFGTYYRLAQADICRLEKELTDDLEYYDNNHKKGEEEDDDFEVHFDPNPTIITDDDSTNYVMVEDDNEDQHEEEHDNHTLFSEDSTELEDDLTSNFEQDLEIMIADQAAEERALDLPQNVARRLNLPREVLNLDTFYNRIGSLLESDE